MLMVDHTTMFWPIGRADEVVFFYGSAGRSLMTHWKLQNGVPKRQFQIEYREGKRTFPYDGTMAKLLGKVKTSVPKRYAKPLQSLLTRRQAYASYIEAAAMDVYFCAVYREDGSRYPGHDRNLEFAPQQYNRRVDRDGFAITEEEQRLTARRS